MPSRKRTVRATEAESARRVNEVMKALIAQESRAEIIVHFTKRWGLDRRQIERYIAKATEHLKAELSEERDDLRATYLATLRQLYRDSAQAEAYQVSLGALRTQIEILGLAFNTGDMIAHLLGQGYEIYVPNSPEALAAAQESAESAEHTIEIGLAQPPIEGAAESETV